MVGDNQQSEQSNSFVGISGSNGRLTGLVRIFKWIVSETRDNVILQKYQLLIHQGSAKMVSMETDSIRMDSSSVRRKECTNYTRNGVGKMLRFWLTLGVSCHSECSPSRFCGHACVIRWLNAKTTTYYLCVLEFILCNRGDSLRWRQK